MNIIPKPLSFVPGEGYFELTPETSICVISDNAEVLNIGQYLAERLRPATGFALPVFPVTSSPACGNILLTLSEGDQGLGDEGYTLGVAAGGVTVTAYRPAGLFWGIQSIRQLLPALIERTVTQAGPWIIPAVTVRDVPRFPWRGAMLDVARHFFCVEDVKRYIDHLAYYKVNRFHIHLSDDQGWRIEIKSWPRLAEYGGSTEVGGGPGGYYTQEQYTEIVQYAQDRHMIVVPEIDMPGHIMAALAAYPELSREGIMPSLYTGSDVGVSSLNTKSDFTYLFIDDVLCELSALTPGPYIHIGGDEAFKTAETDYINFIERVQVMVHAHGKIMVGWQEIARARLRPSTVVQFWNIHAKSVELARMAVEQDARMIMSPASHVYLDMKYDTGTVLGQSWAGFVEVQTAYDWDPLGLVAGLTEEPVLGVEAPLWSETMETLDDIEYMAFPRLPGINEIGWSPAQGRAWDEYRLRLASHASRFDGMGIAFYRSPQVGWG